MFTCWPLDKDFFDYTADGYSSLGLQGRTNINQHQIDTITWVCSNFQTDIPLSIYLLYDVGAIRCRYERFH